MRELTAEDRLRILLNSKEELRKELGADLTTIEECVAIDFSELSKAYFNVVEKEFERFKEEPLKK